MGSNEYNAQIRKIGTAPIVFGMIVVSGRTKGCLLIIGNVAQERVQVESKMDGEKRQVSTGLNGDEITQGEY
jgi:hypothetical protein